MKLAHTRGSVRAFSLIELLVVIAIIGIVIAILIPALRGARIAARNAASKSTVKDLCTASDAFTADKGRSPGYFSATQMGDAANANAGTGGFTGMQNVLLDLAGGVTSPSTALVAGQVFDVGPSTTATVRVDLTKIGAAGAGSKGYFTPNKSLLVVDAGLASSANNKQMPQIVDAFGMPILAWVADTRPAAAFAAVDSSTPAKFYWNSNAGVLNSTSLGREQKSQAYTGTDPCSMIGGPDVLRTMEGLLGNPAFPKANSTPVVPDAPRGPVLFQSAGADGYFMGRFDRGTKSQGTPTYIPYRSGLDVLGDFDDLIQATGN